MKNLKIKTLDEFCEMQKLIMTAYEADVEYDHDTIKEFQGVSFVHINRGTGTSLILMHTFEKYPIARNETASYLFGHATRMEYLESIINSSVDYYKRENYLLITYFDGKQYFDITYKEMAEMLTRYKTKMIEAFRADDMKSRYRHPSAV